MENMAISVFYQLYIYHVIYLYLNFKVAIGFNGSTFFHSVQLQNRRSSTLKNISSV